MQNHQKQRNLKPHVRVLGDLQSRVYFCRSALLVRLSDGLGRVSIVRKPIRDYYKLCFDKKPLVSAHLEPCPTCAGSLKAGYGKGVMSDEACRAVGDRINAGYQGLEDAVQAISPLLGLFDSGFYLVADFELLPVLSASTPERSAFFWDLPPYHDSIKSVAYCGQYIYRDAPVYLYPSQRTADMDPSRIEMYQSRLEEGERFPRSVAFYLNGSIALLLDGHHKAAAAAAAGKRVKCLVVFAVEDTQGRLKDALEQQRRLYFRHGKDCEGGGRLRILDGQDQQLAWVRGLESLQEKNVDVEEEPEASWGTLPAEYRRHWDHFPQESLVNQATMIPPEQIRRHYRLLRESLILRRVDDSSEERRWAERTLDALRAHMQLFPEDRSLSDRQREWLLAKETEELLWRR